AVGNLTDYSEKVNMGFWVTRPFLLCFYRFACEVPGLAAGGSLCNAGRPLPLSFFSSFCLSLSTSTIPAFLIRSNALCLPPSPYCLLYLFRAGLGPGGLDRLDGA